MTKSIVKEREFLSRYGNTIDYPDLKEDKIQEKIKQGHRVRPMYLIKVSQLEKFRNGVIHEHGKIVLHKNDLLFNTLEVDFDEKYKDYLKVKLCVEETHFVPDKILKDDILFFYEIHSVKYFFIIIKDEYMDQTLSREHCIFGMIDFCKGRDLLLTKDNIIKSDMEKFYKKMECLAEKYEDIMFVTISDSILIKHSFKVIGENNMFQFDNLDFGKMIEIFKEIRKIICEIFNMGAYGVFTYGVNKCEPLKSNFKNLFHTGILSSEFKRVIEMEEKCRKFKKENRGDIYVSNVLYKASRFRWGEIFKRSQTPVPYPGSVEWSTPDENIIAMEIPDKSLIYENHNKNMWL